MKISKLDQKFISSLFDEVVLETHKDNKYIGYNTLTNQDFRISINPQSKFVRTVTRHAHV